MGYVIPFPTAIQNRPLSVGDVVWCRDPNSLLKEKKLCYIFSAWSDPSGSWFGVRHLLEFGEFSVRQKDSVRADTQEIRFWLNRLTFYHKSLAWCTITRVVESKGKLLVYIQRNAAAGELVRPVGLEAIRHLPHGE